jgi:hypothetical protein
MNHFRKPDHPTTSTLPARSTSTTHSPRPLALRDLELTLLPQLVVLLDAMPAARWAALEQARNYVRRISTRQFGSADFEQLAQPQLQQLFLTVSDRVRTRREQLGLTPAELDRRAGCGG